MELLRFNHETHKPHIVEWLTGHNMTLEEVDELPSTGFITKDGDVYYAAGFLRFLEASKTALVDGMIANPKTSGKKRNEAMNLVLFSLIDTAEKLKLKSLLAFTSKSAISKRAKRFHCKELDQKMIGLRLGA